MNALICWSIFLPLALEAGKKWEPPIEVNVDTVPSKQDPKRAFYCWVGKADRFVVTNTNPAVSVSIHAKISSLYIAGTEHLPVATQSSFDYIKRGREVRVTIDRERIFIEAPPHIPVVTVTRQ